MADKGGPCSVPETLKGVNAMRTAFFHEDDYCQWEILPLTTKAYCLKELWQHTLTVLGQLASVLLDDWGWGDAWI